jgi:hypothetical protein
LQHHPEGICLFVDGVKQRQVLWKVYERTISGNISYRGGFIPSDKAWDGMSLAETTAAIKICIC